MKMPEDHDPSPAPAFLQEFATFFQQQAQEAEEALRQHYALHEAHLAYLEHALVHVQEDRPEEAEATLLCFLTEEERRMREHTRLLSMLGRKERSPHQERQDALVTQLNEALRHPGQR